MLTEQQKQKLREAVDAGDEARNLIGAQIESLRYLRRKIEQNQTFLRHALSTADEQRAEALIEASGPGLYELTEIVPKTATQLRGAADQTDTLMPKLEEILPPDDPRPPEDARNG